MSCKSDRPKRPRIPGGVIFGLILIGLGAAFLLHNLYYFYIGDVLVYWPCALIVAGLVRIWNRGFFNVWGQILLVGGVLLQLVQLQEYYRGLYFDFIEMWWPALMIWVGLIITVKAFLPRRCRQKAQVQEPPPAHDQYGEWPGHGDEDSGAVPISAGSQNEGHSENSSDNYN